MEEVKNNYTFEVVQEEEEKKSLREQCERKLLAMCEQMREVFKEYLEQIGESPEEQNLSVSIYNDYASVTSIKNLSDLDFVYLLTAHDWEREGFGFKQDDIKMGHKEVAC